MISKEAYNNYKLIEVILIFKVYKSNISFEVLDCFISELEVKEEFGCVANVCDGNFVPCGANGCIAHIIPCEAHVGPI